MTSAPARPWPERLAQPGDPPERRTRRADIPAEARPIRSRRATRLLAQAGVLSAGGHGKVSERLSGTDEMLLSSVSNIAHLGAEQS